jgi:hypothetical protein
MSFLFASSHLPETRVQRPEDEEEDENMRPEPHSGMVRSFSHRPATRWAATIKHGAMLDTDSSSPVAAANDDAKPITMKQITYADKRTKEIVDNVRKADPRLDSMVSELENSRHHHHIDARVTQKYFDSNAMALRGQTLVNDESTGGESMKAHANRHNGIGTSSKTLAAREPITGKGMVPETKSPEQTMTHELQHIHDMSKGVSPQVPPGTFIGKGPLPPTKLLNEEESENRAVRTENIYNQAKKIPLRTKYGGRRVPDHGPEHSPLNVSPPKPSSQQPPTPLQ